MRLSNPATLARSISGALRHIVKSTRRYVDVFEDIELNTYCGVAVYSKTAENVDSIPNDGVCESCVEAYLSECLECGRKRIRYVYEEGKDER